MEILNSDGFIGNILFENIRIYSISNKRKIFFYL